jgi:hypothetical protein
LDIGLLQLTVLNIANSLDFRTGQVFMMLRNRELRLPEGFLSRKNFSFHAQPTNQNAFNPRNIVQRR